MDQKSHKSRELNMESSFKYLGAMLWLWAWHFEQPLLEFMRKIEDFLRNTWVFLVVTRIFNLSQVFLYLSYFFCSNVKFLFIKYFRFLKFCSSYWLFSLSFEGFFLEFFSKCRISNPEITATIKMSAIRLFCPLFRLVTPSTACSRWFRVMGGIATWGTPFTGPIRPVFPTSECTFQI